MKKLTKRKSGWVSVGELHKEKNSVALTLIMALVCWADGSPRTMTIQNPWEKFINLQTEFCAGMSEDTSFWKSQSLSTAKTKVWILFDCATKWPIFLDSCETLRRSEVGICVVSYQSEQRETENRLFVLSKWLLWLQYGVLESVQFSSFDTEFSSQQLVIALIHHLFFASPQVRTSWTNAAPSWDLSFGDLRVKMSPAVV